MAQQPDGLDQEEPSEILDQPPEPRSAQSPAQADEHGKDEDKAILAEIVCDEEADNPNPCPLKLPEKTIAGCRMDASKKDHSENSTDGSESVRKYSSRWRKTSAFNGLSR